MQAGYSCENILGVCGELERLAFEYSNVTESRKYFHGVLSGAYR